MNAHTNEPWPVFTDIATMVTPDPDGTPVAIISWDDYIRARACVNACAGIPNEELECDNVTFAKLLLERAKFRSQRDKLLAALSELIEVTDEPPESNCSCHISPPCNDCVEYSGIRRALECARAAINDIEAS
ncbi:MAG: hypothetical protein KA271_01695 [Propionivibrio sp.]|nr:hypothetical protein [Propionivibrio sp.]